MTPKEQKFCDEYLIDLNAAQAAIRTGYSAKTAKETGYKLLTKVHIQAEISKRRQELAQKTAITQEWVLNNFVELHKDAKDAGDFQAAIKANELVGKHLGFFEKDNDQSKTSISINWAETKTYEAKH
jgi:phage terminase small subunit